MPRRLTRGALAIMFSLIAVATATGGAEPPPPEAATQPAAVAPAAPERADEKEEKEKKAQKPPRPKLRAGISEQQLEHAVSIVKTGQEMGLPRRAYVVALATAMQESRISVLANTNVPHSFDYKPRDGYGSDHDSVGIFQQRVSYYCVNDLAYCMDPRYSAMKFYDGLKRIDDWQNLPVTVAAQRVQGSAFPDHYAKHQGGAEMIVDSILEWQKK